MKQLALGTISIGIVRPAIQRMRHKRLLLLTFKEFKKKILANARFPGELREEIGRSELTFLNIIFGIVPKGMTHSAFYQILSLKSHWVEGSVTFPLLASFPASWDGNHIADWLLCANLKEELYRQVIADNLDGSLLLEGRLHDFLSDGQIDKLNSKLMSKAASMASLAWVMYGESNEIRSVIERFFRIEHKKISSEDELIGILVKKYTLPLLGATKLFDSYLPISEPNFGVFRKVDCRQMVNWDSYVHSASYLAHLCDYGMLPIHLPQRRPRGSWDTLDSCPYKIWRHIKSTIVPEYWFKPQETVPEDLAFLGVLIGKFWYHLERSNDENKSTVVSKYDKISFKQLDSNPPKPILAMVALNFLHQRPYEMLKRLEETEHVSSVLDFPDAGIFAAKIIFLLCLPPPYLESPYCSVRYWFLNLLGEINFRTLENCRYLKELLNGSICFSHFTPLPEIGKEPCRILSTLVRMNAALHLPWEYPGVNLIIPVVLKSGRLGGIFVQVKNWVRSMNDVEGNRRILCNQLASRHVKRINLIMNMSQYVKRRFEIWGSRQRTTILIENCGMDATNRRYSSLTSVMGNLLICRS